MIYWELLKYKKILNFQHQIKSSLLNVKNKTSITLVVTHVCVTTPWNIMLLHSPDQLLKLTRCFSFLPRVSFILQIPINRYAKREMGGNKR